MDSAPAPLAAAPVPIIEEEDDLDVVVKEGAPCRRTGCDVKFVSDAENRVGDGEGTVCTYHPSPVRIVVCSANS
jgi:hypothetical protein